MHPGHDDSGRNQWLIDGLRRALRGSEPLDFLAIISGMLEVTGPRGRSPFRRDDDRRTLDDLVESFMETSYAETTAALTAIRALTGDALLAARIGRGLATRRQPLSAWLAGPDWARLEPDVWFMTHVLGDGDDCLVGVTLDPLRWSPVNVELLLSDWFPCKIVAKPADLEPRTAMRRFLRRAAVPSATETHDVRAAPVTTRVTGAAAFVDQATSKRSSSMTFVQAATKSLTNLR